jgi:hypothetical protein
MSKQNKTYDPKAQLRYNPHDLSHQLKFTSSVGQLLPVYYDFLSPGDKIEITPQMFSRLQNMTSPAFTRLTEHVDFFAVPMNQLFSPFEAIFYGVKDFRSDFFSDIDNTKVKYPQYQLSQVKSFIGSSADIFGVKNLYNASRLGDLLGIPHTMVDLPQTNNLRPNPILLQAYQKIYQDFYRLSSREEKDVESYNLDSFYNQTLITSRDRIIKLFKLHYRPWKKDYFTNISPTPLVDNASIGMLHNWSPSGNLPKWLNSLIDVQPRYANASEYQSPRPDDFVTDVSNTSITEYEGSGGGESIRMESVMQLKSMFSLYKLLELTAKAGKTIDKQQLAHFGVRMPKGADGEVIYLGSSHGIIQVDSVVASADTNIGDVYNPLGSLGGKAQGSMQGRKVSYTATEHCIIMGIYSCVPESDYSTLGLDYFHTYVYPENFFKPELEQLGKRPMFQFEAQLDNESSMLNNSIIGWVEQWRELKQKYDKTSAGLLTNWKNWVTQRVVNGSELSNFLINPNMLDSIMLVPFDKVGDSGLTSDLNPWATDPLIHVLHFDSRKLSKMSVETDKVKSL